MEDIKFNYSGPKIFELVDVMAEELGIRLEEKQTQSQCNCASILNKTISPNITAHKVVCPNCKAINYIDVAPINWKKIFSKERTYGR